QARAIEEDPPSPKRKPRRGRAVVRIEGLTADAAQAGRDARRCAILQAGRHRAAAPGTWRTPHPAACDTPRPLLHRAVYRSLAFPLQVAQGCRVVCGLPSATAGIGNAIASELVHAHFAKTVGTLAQAVSAFAKCQASLCRLLDATPAFVQAIGQAACRHDSHR